MEQGATQVELLVELVGDRINAQVAAHEKYSQAFIKILDTLDAIIDNQEKLGVEGTDTMRDVLKDLSEISTDLRIQQENAKVWKDVVGEKLEKYATITHDRMEQMIRQMVELNARSAKSLDALETKMGLLNSKCEEISKAANEHNAKAQAHMDVMQSVPNQITQLIVVKQNWRKWLERVAIGTGIALAIIGVLAELVQFGILKMSWFGH